jgi:hypothetical protein
MTINCRSLLLQNLGGTWERSLGGTWERRVGPELGLSHPLCPLVPTVSVFGDEAGAMAL